jgi:hypothetical protein
MTPFVDKTVIAVMLVVLGFPPNVPYIVWFPTEHGDRVNNPDDNRDTLLDHIPVAEEYDHGVVTV